MITIAPELPGSMDVIRYLSGHSSQPASSSQVADGSAHGAAAAASTSGSTRPILGGIVTSIGHTNATLSTAQAAVDSGANMITHLFNAMPPLHHREPGVLGLLGPAAPASQPPSATGAAAMPSGHGPAAVSNPIARGTAAESAAASFGADSAAVTSRSQLEFLKPSPSVTSPSDVTAARPTATAAANSTSTGSSVTNHTAMSSTGGQAFASSSAASSAARVPYYGLITDGVHVHPSAISMAYRSNPSRAINVTDAMRAMGLGPGKHTYGGESVEVFNGAGPGDGYYKGVHVVVEGTNTLAGAVLPLDSCVRNFKLFTGCSVDEAVATVTAHPARLLGLLEEDGGHSAHGGSAAPTATNSETTTRHPSITYGALRPGAVADFVLLDDTLSVVATYLAGECVYSR